jgi:adenylate cyclase class 2
MESRYEIFPVTDPSLKDLLAKALGVKTIVEKVRRLLKLKNARIHLDEVKGLGSFLEFEVVSGGDDRADTALLETLKTYAAPFVVKEIKESYSDLRINGEAAKN